MCSSAAARVKLPARASARNARICRMSWITLSPESLSFSLITEIRTIQLSNSGARFTFKDVPSPYVSPAGVPQPWVARRIGLSPVRLNLVFFGPPGAGKGTQADRFAARHHIPKISTGDILRKAIQDGTRVGQLVRATLQCGSLVGDDLMISIV